MGKKLNDEQQAAVDNLSAQQRLAFDAKRSLLHAEAALVESKTDSSVEDEALRDAKLLLRTQRQAYRETHRDAVISFEQRYSLWTTVDGFEPQDNPPVYVKQGG